MDCLENVLLELDEESIDDSIERLYWFKQDYEELSSELTQNQRNCAEYILRMSKAEKVEDAEELITILNYYRERI